MPLIAGSPRIARAMQAAVGLSLVASDYGNFLFLRPSTEMVDAWALGFLDGGPMNLDVVCA